MRRGFLGQKVTPFSYLSFLSCWMHYLQFLFTHVSFSSNDVIIASSLRHFLAQPVYTIGLWTLSDPPFDTTTCLGIGDGDAWIQGVGGACDP